jgi:SAM-dependent methyltransferase
MFYLQEMRPWRQRARREVFARHAAFDRRYGVQTAGFVKMYDPRWSDPLLYLPVDERDLDEAMRYLDMPPQQCHFIDYGSGKGKALLLAAERGFRRVTGIEYNPTLHQLAMDNLERAAARRAWSAAPVSLCGDATAFRLPVEPCVLFFYNPFGADVMRPLVRRIEAWHARFRQPLWVVYINPLHADVWRGAGFMRAVCDSPDMLVMCSA